MNPFFPRSPVVNTGQPLQLPYGDSMRVLATLAVLLNHAVIPLAFDSVAPGHAERDALFCIGATWTRWCVPMFFMLSGALLLDPFRTESATVFYRRRLMRVGVPTIIWTVFYLFESHWARGLSLQPFSVIKAVAAGRPAYHLWFVYALLCLYFVTPTIKSVFLKATLSEQWQLTGGLLILSAVAALRWAAEGTMGWQIPPDPAFIFEWVFYLGYFLCGYLLRTVVLSRIGLFAALIVAGGLMACSGYGFWKVVQFGEKFRGEGFLMSYLSPLNVLMSLAVFLLIATLCCEDRSKSRVMRVLGGASFGAYLIHVFVLDLLWNAVEQVGFPISVTATVVVWCLAVLISFGFGLIASRTPLFRIGVGG